MESVRERKYASEKRELEEDKYKEDEEEEGHEPRYEQTFPHRVLAALEREVVGTRLAIEACRAVAPVCIRQAHRSGR